MRDSRKGGALTDVTHYILHTLFEPSHGYGVIRFIEQLIDKCLCAGGENLYGAVTFIAG